MPGETVLVIDDSPTILKVVQLVLTRAGYRVDIAADGESGLDAARASHPDLILLDFVMPRMNGYQVCRELAADPDLKNVPIVLMSAKGDQVGERFVKVMGIVDYITKPFSPEAITGVVQHSIRKYGDRSAEEYTNPIVRGAHDVDPADPGGRPGQSPRERALAAARDRIAEAVAPAIVELVMRAEDVETIDATSVAEIAKAALRGELLAGVARDIDAAEADEIPSLEGDLRVVPIADVLHLLDSQSQSGTLVVARGAGEVKAYFRRGNLQLALAEGIDDEFLLGRFLVDTDGITGDDLDAFLEARTPGNQLIGTELVSLGLVTEAGLRAALARQTRELVYEMLRWSFGSFRFVRSRELPAPATEASLELDVPEILMEGFRRVDEWHLIEREIDDFETVFLRNEDAVAQMGRARLTREELTVLELVNGKNTVKEIIRASRIGSFEVSKMLYRLLSIKLIRRRVMPVAV
jgi:CheY-like chemotaxis protein